MFFDDEILKLSVEVNADVESAQYTSSDIRSSIIRNWSGNSGTYKYIN